MPLPTNITPPAPSVYAESTKGTRFSMEVPMLMTTTDGKQLHLPMVVLTPREQREVEVNSFNDTRSCFKEVPKKDEPGMDTWDKIMSDNRAIWTLYYSVRKPGDLKTKWFEDKKQIEDSYTPEELGTLCNHYVTVKLNQPHMKLFDPEKPEAFQALIDSIKKDAQSDFFLNGLTTHSVNQLVKYLVSQLQSYQKDSGSSGEP